MPGKWEVGYKCWHENGGFLHLDAHDSEIVDWKWCLMFEADLKPLSEEQRDEVNEYLPLSASEQPAS